MIAKFKTAGALAYRGNESRVVLYGEVVEDLITDGMVVNIPFGRSISMGYKIESVEVVDRPEESRGSLGLVLERRSDDEDLPLLEQIDFAGTILDITQNG